MLKVAFATTDRVRVDQHFGTARSFVLYALDAQRARLLGVAEFADQGMDGDEGKLAAKIAALDGCAAVYCQAVGGSAVRQLLAAGIQPLRLERAEPIAPLLEQLRQALSRGGTPWIDKALQRTAAPEEQRSRFARMAAEGWQE